MKCKICNKDFEGRPGQLYCSIKCRRKAEMAEKKRKRQARYDAWRASWTPAEREFWDSIPEFEIDWAPEQEKAWQEMTDNLPTLNRPEKG